jgi:hypothetical protein
MKGHQDTEGREGSKGNNYGFTTNTGKSDELYPKSPRINVPPNTINNVNSLLELQGVGK